jgi:hypothetical protein
MQQSLTQPSAASPQVTTSINYTHIMILFTDTIQNLRCTSDIKVRSVYSHCGIITVHTHQPSPTQSYSNSTADLQSS